MKRIQATIESMTTEELSRFVVDLFHRIAVHHGLWFTEIIHQMGMEKALEAMDRAYSRSYDVQMKRLGRFFNFEVENGVPAPIAAMPRETLLALTEEVAKNWLANDGVWFQTVEFDSGMFDAKRCNDSCWARFSPFEAWSIKKFLELPGCGGLDALKTALGFRLYARINKQSIVEESENSFVFMMNECRVQAARRRKGLPDYPCKSAGIVEYPYFAKTIDPRIRTECVGCPPDDHPEEWFCAWRFILQEGAQTGT
jgi:hypothetical protein